MMSIMSLLKIYDQSLVETDIKVHLACHNGIEDPYEDVFLLGKWKDWQEGQTRKNFSRKYILSLIQMKNKSNWMFAGIFTSDGIRSEDERLHYYNTTPVVAFDEMVGRLVIEFKKDFRNSYPFLESISKELVVSQILASRAVLNSFQGYDKVFLKFIELQYIIQNQMREWITALSAVSGVYLITDSSCGKLYIGSAYGEGGLIGRWSQYVLTGHAGNKLLKELLNVNENHANHFRFSILETFDISTSPEDVIRAESFWKDKLGSRLIGYNDN